MKEIIKAKSIAIVGTTGSGKTSLGYHICEFFREIKDLYILSHPKPELLVPIGFKNLESLEQLENMQDCLVWIDEPQLHIKTYDKKANLSLQRLLSLCRQKDITLILSTSDTRFITRGLEAYMDVWLIKDIEPALVKQGSMIKKIIKKHTWIDIDGFSLLINQFIFYSRNIKGLNGKHTFGLVKYWSEKLSKPYKNTEPNPENNSEKTTGENR